MKVNNQWIRGIWSDDGGKTVCFPDQTKLPFRLEICREGTSDALIRAIKSGPRSPADRGGRSLGRGIPLPRGGD